MSNEALAVKALRSAADKYESKEVDWFGNGKPSSFDPTGDLIPRRCAVMAIGSEAYAVTSFTREEAKAVADVAYKAMTTLLPEPGRYSLDQDAIVAWNDRKVEGGVHTVIATLRQAADNLEAQQS